jgi:hypothetical protein
MSMWNWVNPAEASQPTPSRALSRGKRLALQNELAGTIRRARELKAQLDASPAEDFADAVTACAALTDTVEDDIEVARRIRDKREQELEDAADTGDPRLIVDAAETLKDAIDAMNSLEQAVAEDHARQEREREALRRHTDALRANADEIKRTHELAAEALTKQSEFQMKRYLVDIVSAQIGDPTAKTVETHRRDEGEWEKQVIDRADRRCEAVEAGNRCPNTQNLKAVAYGSKRRVEDGAALCPKHVVSHG